MPKKKDDAGKKVPEHVRKAQEEFLRQKRKDDPDEEIPYAIDWKSGEPRNDPKHKP